MILTGIFSQSWIANLDTPSSSPSSSTGGVLDGRPILLVYQFIAVIVCTFYTAFVTFIILKILDRIPGFKLRCTGWAEQVGIDSAELGEGGDIYMNEDHPSTSLIYDKNESYSSPSSPSSPSSSCSATVYHHSNTIMNNRHGIGIEEYSHLGWPYESKNHSLRNLNHSNSGNSNSNNNGNGNGDGRINEKGSPGSDQTMIGEGRGGGNDERLTGNGTHLNETNDELCMVSRRGGVRVCRWGGYEYE